MCAVANMHTCMYVCMYICKYECMCVCMYSCMYVCMYMCMEVCVYVCMYIEAGHSVYVCMYPQIQECNAYVCMYAGLRTFDAVVAMALLSILLQSDLSLTPLHPILAKHTSYLVMSSIITSTYGHTRYAYKDMCKHFIDVFCRCTKTCLLIC